MIELEENLRGLKELKNKLNDIKDSMKIDSLKSELKVLEEKSLEENFWNDLENSSKIFTKIKTLQKKIKLYEDLKLELDNLIEMNELLQGEFEENLASELIENTSKIEKKFENLEIQTLFSGKYDANNAIITMHPGAGGTESQDWVQMLYRMYAKWASANGFSLKELDYLDGDEAGIKSVTFLISGENAYGYLKGEMGVHRLVRISPSK